ncbi:MAG: hypothetical protein R2698_13555 [Microthrixaceae bacterium]
MDKVLLLAALVVSTVVIVRLRASMAADRKETLARLDAERRVQGADYSPTAELFRKAGVSAEQLAVSTMHAGLRRPAVTDAPTEVPPDRSAETP